ncbi:MAG: hypothetical protein ACRC6V_10450 [Bacteroidales bacterium]
MGLSIQVRFYNKDLSFQKTITCNAATTAIVEYTAALMGREAKDGTTREDRKPFNLCNLMVRKNGKLVSYKEVINDR